jgi:hypothetical protein
VPLKFFYFFDSNTMTFLNLWNQIRMNGRDHHAILKA